MALIELGLIDTNYFGAAHVDTIEAAINTSSYAGDVKMSISTTADLGWLMLNGQVVANAQSLYPSLWAKADATWKSGASLNLPNMAQRFPMGGSVGTIGGANAKTIAAANLPAHQHDLAHDHPSASFTTDSNDAIEPTYRTTWSHKHGPGESATAFVTDGSGDGHPGAGISATGSGYVKRSFTGLEAAPAGHIHVVNGSVDIPPIAGNTGNGPGTSTALDVTPAYITFNFMIRAF